VSYINDSSSQSELVRLNHQARLVTDTIGLLPARLEDTDFTSVLDVGCGTGQWALDLACARQDVEVTGIDISPNMIEYAITRAQTYRLDNISFEVVDIFQKKLPFTEGSFDMINLRFGFGWIKGYANWLLLLARLSTLLKPGGSVVITEGEGIYTNSLALQRVHEIFCIAFHKAGYSLSPSPRFMGVVAQLGYLLSQTGFHDPGSQAYVLDYSYYNQEANIQWRTSFHLLLSESAPFLLSAGANTEELATLDFQISLDMYRESFCGMGPLFSFYARKEEGLDG
jgi:ubiquinone/menaquinone biosynthesis C-methylase UbiE